MSEKIQRQHTVLSKAHLREYFGGRLYRTYDLKTGKWENWGPRTLGRIKEYHEHPVEYELQKVDNNAISGVRKLAKRHILSDEDRGHVAWYIAACLLRNPTLFDELLPEMLQSVKRITYCEEVAAGVDTTQHEVDAYVDQNVGEAGFQREMHGAWLDHAQEYRTIASNIYDLSWHILYVARKPNCLLLTDRPFLVRFPTHPTEAMIDFPISHDVMLRIFYDPATRWQLEPMERKDVIAHGRNLITKASNFVAYPKQDDPRHCKKLARMIERVCATKTAQRA